jgi:hypothetical protein
MSKKISELPQYIGTSQPTGDIPISIGGTTYKIDPSLLLQIKTIEGQTLIGTGNIDLTKSNVGLANVDNTADIDKPISTATQTALNGKEDVSNKSSSATLGTSDTLYPTQKAVKTYVDNQATPDATTLIKGKIKLAGDLAGTADAPTVPALNGKIGGSGTDNYVPRFNGTNAIENSQIFDNGTNIGFGTASPLGILHLYKSSATTRMLIDGDAGQNKIITYRTNGVQRFGFYLNNTAESGSNTGSDFQIRAYNDAGALLSTPFFIKRSIGHIGIGTTNPGSKLTVNGDIKIEGNGSLYVGGGGSAVPTWRMSPNGNDLEFSGVATNTSGNINFLNFGNIGIGTTSPGVKFVNSGSPFSSAPVLGSATVGSQALLSNTGLYGLYSGVSSNGDVWQQVQRNDGNSAVYNIALQPNGGNIYIGTNAPIYGTSAKMQFLFNGLNEFGINFKSTAVNSIPIHFTSSAGTQAGYIFSDLTGVYLVSISDYRLKEDLNSFNALDLISKINVYDYKWKDQEKRSFGVMAHELQEVIPQATFGEKDGETMQGVNYSTLVPILVQAIQEQQTQIKELRNLINK